MTRDQFHRLFRFRAAQALEAVGFQPDAGLIDYNFKHHAHFDTVRGYALCYEPIGGVCHISFAGHKVPTASHARLEGVVRHELGHAIDFLVPKKELDQIGAAFGYRLPTTDERRADAIAMMIWGDTIYYDARDLVQTLDSRSGYPVRPERLGL